MTDQDNGVLARITVDPLAPLKLPPPGAPWQVPETSSKGDLNAKLRWAAPEDLRRLALGYYGYNLYRMPRAFAEAKGYTNGITASNLVSLALTGPDVRRVNEMPILINKVFGTNEAGNFALDPKTYFVADDNGRYKPGGKAFANGSQFYYFVTARDVLGRDGAASPPGLATLCDRVPPEAPRGLQVVNDYSFDPGTSTTKQVLRVKWTQLTNLTQDNILGYYIYRWDDPNQAQTLGANPLAHRIAGPIPHVPGQKLNTYVDDGPGSPQAPADYNRTYWYTVRAVDDGACDGGNVSANSAPAFGVLRDREGPGGPTGDIGVLCCLPEVRSGRTTDTPDSLKQDESLAYYQFVCDREDAAIAWAEFYINDPSNPTNFLGRVPFLREAKQASIRWETDRAGVSEGYITFFCRVGSTDDLVSSFAQVQTIRAPKYSTVREVAFVAKVNCERVPLARDLASGQRSPCGGSHTPHPPGTDITIGIDITIHLTPGTKEFRLYRRVDFGPLTLIKQGPANYDDVHDIAITDPDMPANSGTICYYGQLFDEHGNASPITLLDNCLTLNLPTARPLLTPISAEGEPDKPQMTLRWFCAPYGIERFEVYIATTFVAMPTNITSELSTFTSYSPTNKTYTFNGTTTNQGFYVYRTPQVGPAFGNGAMFEVTASITANQRYTVFIKPVGKDGEPQPDSQNSNVQEFEWTQVAPIGPKVPWPDRPLPPLAVFNTNIFPAMLDSAGYRGVGLLVGATGQRALPGRGESQPVIRTATDPISYLFTNKAGEKLFPLVVYRYQFGNVFFPKVSGDLVQVTPLMEKIAYAVENDPSLGTSAVIYDPFILVTSGTIAGDQKSNLIWLLDTQPVISGARYAYLLVRFDAYGEIKDVSPTFFVDVNSTP